MPAPKQARTPSAPASTNKRKLPDNEGGGNRLEDNKSESFRTVEKRSRLELGLDG